VPTNFLFSEKIDEATEERRTLLSESELEKIKNLIGKN